MVIKVFEPVRNARPMVKLKREVEEVTNNWCYSG